MADLSEREMGGALANLENLRATNRHFLDSCRVRPQPDRLPIRLEVVGDDTLRVACFPDVQAIAKARFVRIDTYVWAAEYVFKVEQGDTDVEVARFYVHDSSAATLTPDPDTAKLFYTASLNLVEVICWEVQAKLLLSSIVKPTEPLP